MAKKFIFRGAATALITPTTADGVDMPMFRKLIDWQIEQGIDGLVVTATTGENPTLTDEEHKACISVAIEQAAGRVPIIAGTGSNYTDHAIEMTRFACAEGADGVLCVTPYYNKATQSGLVAMYNAIADASTKPIIVYNVPSRTGCNIEPETYVRIAEHENIWATKEANGNISAIADTARLTGDRLAIYSGNDDQIVPILALGGDGVISVLSNIMPKQTAELCRLWFEGNHDAALKMQLEYLPLIHALFSEVNPIPVKAAMAAMGWCEDYLRLPLTQMSEGKRAVLMSLMKEQGLL
ncbi:MAG: 4-hydroxy-tetrahydrodipicolinate synthase [Lachnospiraceae bacterium]|nr:4-hydroxy-tetrahydrodipicolinate synthase [Lachnospiraceae bacterium]